MTKSTSRRFFMKSSAVLAAGAAAGKANAIGPIERRGNTTFKLSLAGYSFRQKEYLNNGEGPMSLLDFADLAADWGLDAIEPTSYYFPPDVSEDFILKLKRHCHLLGLEISGVPIRSHFTNPPGEPREKELAHLKKWVDYAALLGAPTIRVFAGNVPEGATLEQAQAWCVEAIQEALDYAGSKGVFLAMENHGGIVADAEGLLHIVHAVDHPWFGVNLDSGNFHGADPYEQLMRCAPYAVMVQYKVKIKRDGQDAEPADFNRILDILRSANYRGTIVLEYEEKEDPMVAVPKYVRQLQQALG